MQQEPMGYYFPSSLGPYHCFYRVSAIFYMPTESQTKISLLGSCPLKRSIVIYAYGYGFPSFFTGQTHSTPILHPLHFIGSLRDLFHTSVIFTSQLTIILNCVWMWGKKKNKWTEQRIRKLKLLGLSERW